MVVEKAENLKGVANAKGSMPKARLGTGARFKKLTRQLSRKGVKNPKALAAWIGRKNLGKAKFQKLAAAGRRRHK